MKADIRKRDGNRCGCGRDDHLRVHHIIPLYKIVYRYNPRLSLEPDKIALILNSPEFTDVSNGITLCISCHMKRHLQ